MVTKEFEILMDYLGWGDPDALLWTVGIEEAGEWCTDEEAQKFPYVKENIRKFSGKVIPISPEEDPKFPISHPISKIACGISGSCQDWKCEWRNYRRNKLWKKGSRICNINVYPLGKKSLKSSFPKCYKKLFGIDSWKEYVDLVKKRRFQKIRDFYKENQPQAVICYGKRAWDDFVELFELENEKAKEDMDKLTKVYFKKRIILTRHFSYGFKDSICEFIIEHLKRWNLKIP